ncbi:hypothetical protein [Shewanella atlantica]|uniref:Essential protein Yae1 N-terminal domain-containing protein n=1 Tax=Shewanella atlantica TaxID=271099 RepID=A0A431WCG3_9GAMM|nr:hypothetical protein [Shewanella atlantica]RTR33203.1 hypothetical protein EKG39_05500 [Shewanella atlantica]
MTNEEIKALIQTSVNQGLAAGYNVGLEQGKQQGMAAGLTQGEQLGFIKGVRFCQSAVSDGTRKGSSKCAQVLKFLDGLDD